MELEIVFPYVDARLEFLDMYVFTHIGASTQDRKLVRSHGREISGLEE